MGFAERGAAPSQGLGEGLAGGRLIAAAHVRVAQFVVGLGDPRVVVVQERALQFEQFVDTGDEFVEPDAAAAPGGAQAMANAPHRTCKGVGTITVHCYRGDNGQWAGEYDVQAAYNPEEDSCMPKNGGYQCFKRFPKLKEVGVHIHYGYWLSLNYVHVYNKCEYAGWR